MSYVPKILIVDDDPRMCDSLKVLLGNEGYEIQTRHNGQEALEALVKNEFDIVLLDFVLPDISGAEIMDHINSQTPETFVIVITGYTSSESVVDALKKGAFDYLRKPFEHEELSKAVKNALDQKALKMERKRVEETLRESEEKYKTLIESSHTGNFIHQDGKYVFVNDRFAEIHGYSPEELLGKEYLRLIHSDERDAFAKIASARLRGEAVPQRYEARRLGKDGKTIWCEMMATRIEYEGRPAIMGNIIDITERKLAQEALLESEKKFRDLYQDAPMAYFSIGIDGTIDDCNKMAQEVSGYKREDLIGKDVMELFSDSPDGKEKAEVIFHRFHHGEVILHERIRMIKKDRSLAWGSLTLNVTIDQNGKIIATRCMISDISEHVNLEAQLQQAQKMESIGTLAGGIAHDFNNLLMGIQGNVDLMNMHIDSTHPFYKRLKNIEKQVQSGARLTSHLLGYARKGRYEIKPINLNIMVEATCETFGRTKKEITIHRALAGDLFAIEADHGQIEQVLLNLFVNAADAMPGGGDLILKTMNTTNKNMKGKLYDPKPGNYVLLTVTDTGIGMDTQTMERIFDPFFTTKEMGRGTGLGLASAYGIIRGHGGYIDVESKKGHGTTFRIYLPSSEKKVQKAVKIAGGFVKGTGTVLLVDDEDVILEVGQDLLEAMGYRVLIAKDGKEAIEIYRENQDDIDFVLLDMVMPNMGGGGAYDRMKEINPDVKVLLSSGYSIDGEATEILERGCNGFIQKPFNMKELSGIIKDILDN